MKNSSQPQTTVFDPFDHQLRKKIYYFLFINSRSGNKLGSKYSELCSKKIKYIFGDQFLSYVLAFDLFDQQRTKIGFSHAKVLSEELEQNRKTLKNDVRIIICGGDGTIPWVLHCASQENINFSNVVIGVMPIGTGNDFSRSLGWGYNAIEISKLNIQKLHDTVRKWNNAQLGFYDIWDIQIETFENGCFYDIKDQVQVKQQKTILKRSFTNYFGIGLDARVVYSVEKERGSNAFFNKLLYTFVGAKNFFKSMQNIEHAIQVFKEIKSELLNEEPKSIKVQKVSELIEKQQKNMILETQESQRNEVIKQKIQLKQRIFQMQRGFKGLVCLNCTSYMCGLKNCWMTKKSTDKSLKNNMQRQQFDDGKLEFIAFNNELTLALERIFRTGVRIAQGEGPFEIIFKQNRETSETFMQIDGQSLKIQNIKCIKIRKSQKYPDGHIRVMINKKKKKI